MTLNDLQRGNELAKKINTISENIVLLDDVLDSTDKKTKRYFFSCREKNKIHIDGGCISFGGQLEVDRETYDRPNAHTLVVTVFRNIDNLVKEMTEANDGKEGF